jgi:UDP-4-amino-4,6-dideoxy-N-acetyl-beta-L-altrosamine N-acetyltransferase
MSIVLQKYGITLRRIEQSDIELVRQWRNNSEINRFMAYREYISPDMQQRWFESINNPLNYYMMIIVDDKSIGVINTKNVNLEEGFGEGGIFIWEQEYWKTFIPTLASLMMLEFTFEKITGFDFSVIRVLTDNEVAMRYNKALGYVLIPEQTTQNPIYVLTRQKYKHKTSKFIRTAEKMMNDLQPIRYFITQSPSNLAILNEMANS